MTGDDVRLKSPLPCWHESVASARTDPLVTLSVHGGHIETPRPVPPGTPLFLELSLGQSLGAEKAERGFMDFADQIRLSRYTVRHWNESVRPAGGQP